MYSSYTKLVTVVAICCVSLCGRVDRSFASDFTNWFAFPPEFIGGKPPGHNLRLDSGLFRGAESRPWQSVGWFTQSPARDAEIETTITVTRLATEFEWFG